MPLNALRRVESLMSQVVRDIQPARFITEVAKVDKPGYFRNFKGYRTDRFSRNKIESIARKELFERENEVWAQLFIVLWNNTHRDVYNGFKNRVETINENVEEVEAIEDDVALGWLEELLQEHTLEDLLLCVHLNEVRFTDGFVREHMEKPLEIDRSTDLPFPPEHDDAEDEG